MDTISKKILLSAGIGLGVAVSGVSLYLLFKPEDDPYLKPAENERRKIRQTNQSVVTIRVPKQYVGAVIGRGGEQIKRIQFDTKTRINFDDSNGGNGGDQNGMKDMRILLIKGTPDNTAKAEMAINEIIREQSSIVTKHFSVETTAIGGIIGRNGENIRYFRSFIQFVTQLWFCLIGISATNPALRLKWIQTAKTQKRL